MYSMNVIGKTLSYTDAQYVYTDIHRLHNIILLYFIYF